MKVSKLLILLTLIQTACTPIGKPLMPRTNPLVVPYVKQWENITNRKQHTPIIIGTVSDEFFGICYKSSDPYYNIIILNKNFFYGLDSTEKLELVMHELGHCDLGYEHNSKPALIDGCPYSIMNAYLFNSSCFNADYDHYISEYLNEE
jgi:hypothetical protein